MSIKAILVPLNGSDTGCDSSALTSALTFSDRFSGNVDALHVKRDPRAAASFVGEGMTTSMIESVIDMAEKDSQKREAAASALFNELCSSRNISIEREMSDTASGSPTARFISRPGNQEDLLPEYGRMFDLIVVCKKTVERNSDNQHIINSAILETGRPVLVVNEALKPDFGKRIAVIWNGSVESSRAISLALPVLKTASEVSLICAVDDLSEKISPDEAVRYLSLYGIQASTCIVHGSGGRSTAATLLAEAEKFNADLLVMGAYTQGKLRRLLFGAVTAEMLGKCKLPILMAH
ncbi:MAG: universal stress protein [Sneathiella sp.]|nr:universal stress protein [Sneathiella sp.]